MKEGVASSELISEATGATTTKRLSWEVSGPRGGSHGDLGSLERSLPQGRCWVTPDTLFSESQWMARSFRVFGSNKVAKAYAALAALEKLFLAPLSWANKKRAPIAVRGGPKFTAKVGHSSPMSSLECGLLGGRRLLWLFEWEVNVSCLFPTVQPHNPGLIRHGRPMHNEITTPNLRAGKRREHPWWGEGWCQPWRLHECW